MVINTALWRKDAHADIIDKQLKGADIREKPRAEVDTNVKSVQPLLILMHGWGSNEADLPGVISAIEQMGAPHINWVSLRAPMTMDKMYGPAAFAWMDPALPDTASEASREANARTRETQAAASAGDVIDWVNSNVSEGTPIILLGFSQGALMVTEVIKQADQLVSAHIKAGIILSGFVSENTATFTKTSQIPTFCGYGLLDDVISQQLLQQCADWLAKNTDNITSVYPNLSHSIDFNEARDVGSFLKGVIND